jgi:endogenous inhibitor of DNA gyrase (YacG/DUF329 family)
MDLHTRPCPLCARSRTAADAAGVAWSSQHEPDGSTTWICPTCTRAQLWRIEAQLRVATPTAPAAAVPVRPAA